MVGPGSVHITGVVYTVENLTEFATVPTWTVEAVKAKTNGHKASNDGFTDPGGYERFALPDVIEYNERDNTLFRYASSLLARELPRHEAEILMRSAWERCAQPPQARDYFPVEKALETLNRYEPGRSEGLEPKGGMAEESAAGRSQVDVRNDADAADWLRNQLGQGELSGIFRREDLLVHTPRIGEDGYIPPEDLGLVDAGPAQVRPLTTTQVKSLIETRYQCWKTVGSGDNRRVVAALFPQQSATSACESARLGEYASHLKVLHGVTHTPTIRPDGTILAEPGYDPTTKLLYLPDLDLTIPPIPDRPTAEQVAAARELILEPIAEFPFVSEDDRATWIGLAFTPILRPLLPARTS